MRSDDVRENAIEGTTKYMIDVQAGKVSGKEANDRLVELTGGIPDYNDDDSMIVWEQSVVGTLAHNISNINETYPVVILDWNSNAVFQDLASPHQYQKHGHYVWETHRRPSRRPRPPHGITDELLIYNAKRQLAAAAATNKIVLIPIIGQHKGRTVFEVALLAVFPELGAWAWRKIVRLSNRWAKAKFDEALRDDKLLKWVISATIFSSGNDYAMDAIAQASLDSYIVHQHIARNFFLNANQR